MDALRDQFWTLAEAEHLPARAYCRKLMGGRDDGDDLYHDALVQARLHFGDLRDADAFRSWLYRIIINTFRKRVRRPWWKRRLSISDSQLENSKTFDPAPGYASRRLLERAFRAISTTDQALITLFEMDGWTIAELSALSGRSEQAIRVRLHRARRKMRDALVPPNHEVRPGKAAQLIAMEELLCAVKKSDAT
jgi:RNA polymerase sigma-70 factor (ECF subfamily)